MLRTSYTSTADVPRTTFASHPWSIGGGGAADLKEQIDETAASHVLRIMLIVDRHSCA